MEPERYECISDAANDIKILKQTVIYTYKNKWPLIERRKSGAKVFYIEWFEPYIILCCEAFKIFRG